eukprot:5589725-Pyramimonas_sp.AAC.1
MRAGTGRAVPVPDRRCSTRGRYPAPAGPSDSEQPWVGLGRPRPGGVLRGLWGARGGGGASRSLLGTRDPASSFGCAPFAWE